MRRRIGVVVLAAVAAAGCGGTSGSPTTATTTETTVTSTPSEPGPTTDTGTPDLGTDVLRPRPTDTPKGRSRPGPGEAPVGAATPMLEPGRIDPGVRTIADRAVDDLAARLDVDPGEVEVVAAVAVVWPDAGLGCPQPGMSYAQVLVDGSLVELRADGRVYRYHAGGDGQPFPCDLTMSRLPRILSP